MEIKISKSKSIFFDEYKHWFTDAQGKYIPSVSTIASGFNEAHKLKMLMKWAVNKDIDYVQNNLDTKDIHTILQEARTYHDVYTQQKADIGTATHNWIENYIKGKTVPFPTDPNVVSAIQGFMSWVDKCNVKFLESEIKVYSQTLNVAGILDGIAQIGDKVYLIDFKTGKSIYKSNKVQLAGYKLLYEEMYKKKIDYMLLIHLDTENGKFKAIEVPEKGVSEVFIYLTKVNNWFSK